MCRDHAAVVEADLQQTYGVDYRDRWRTDLSGRPLLSLRRLWVLVSQLPGTSRIAQLEKPWFSVEAHLLDDLRMTLVAANTDPKKSGPPEPHPMRPQPSRHPKGDPEFEKKLAAARRYNRDRKRRIARGEL